jgi:hypothetical protein
VFTSPARASAQLAYRDPTCERARGVRCAGSAQTDTDTFAALAKNIVEEPVSSCQGHRLHPRLSPLRWTMCRSDLGVHQSCRRIAMLNSAACVGSSDHAGMRGIAQHLSGVECRVIGVVVQAAGTTSPLERGAIPRAQQPSTPCAPGRPPQLTP